MMFARILYVSHLVVLCLAQTPDFLPEPERFWQRSLNTYMPADGNAVVLSPDESVLYVTTRDGRLFPFNPSNGRLLLKTPVMPKVSAVGWGIECQSGVTFSRDTALYAIVDQPPKDDYTSRKQTRIVAVDRDSDEVTWYSEQFEGEIVGTPVVSLDGKRVMFTRNSVPPPPTLAPTLSPTTAPTMAPMGAPTRTPTVAPTRVPTTATPVNISPIFNDTDNNSTDRKLQQGTLADRVTGYFTVLNAANGRTILDQPATGLLETHLYSPVAIAHNVTFGRFQGAVPGADVVVWHSIASADGVGETQLYQYDPQEQNGNSTSTTSSTIQLSSSDWMTGTTPTISSSGGLFMGTTQGSIRGWVDDRSFDLISNFEVDLDGQMAATQAVLSNDETQLFLTTSDNTFYAIDIESESVAWNIAATMPILTRAVPSPDGSRVYLPVGNNLYALEAATGESIWGPVVNGDGSLVQADFCVSSDGRFLYYVGFKENIVTALKLANAIAPTVEPSASPSFSPTLSPAPTSDPTATPSWSPVAATVATSQPVVVVSAKGPLSSKRIIILAGSIGGGLVLLGGVAIGAMWFLRGRGGGGDGIEMNYDFSKARGAPAEPQQQQQPPQQQQLPQRYSYDPTRV